MRFFFAVAGLLCLSAFGNAAEKTEIGELNGAKFRIDVPEKWNGSLVLYCHGYSAQPVEFKNEPADPLEHVFLDAGFAVAMSAYSGTGWAIQEGEIDTLSLEYYFAAKHGLPKQTFVTGHSMGGLLTVMLAERHPTDFVGAMPMCGVIGPTLQTMHDVFDALSVLNYFLPGALPAPHDIPADYHASKELSQAVADKLEANPKALKVMERYTGLQGAKDIGGALAFEAYVLKEMSLRAGGNMVDNRSTIYQNTGEDNAVNAGVKRYTADPKAVEYVRAYYTPSYRIERPMLAIHTTYDTLVPPAIPNGYAQRAQILGTGDWFVQQYVPNDGHCNISPQEVASGFAELRAWVDSGKKPSGGQVPVQ